MPKRSNTVKISAPSVKRGELVQLVRWRPVDDGWTYDVVDGLYQRRDRVSITLQVEGEDEPAVFNRDEWEWCAA
ncbi:hypothetical protein NY551_18880 [Curtobacterium flaccumfaciens pv. oortii]|uniref:hypothetical protein n=1 Tax=Curtobacterium flaccumfaciens TaxID=2035 RepID=UPI00265942FB|nr:hypothetical protein [Curtobacterium flaccumfaciens]MCS5524805.1 hypothetical protein [Curtobacterium flaccumfaciens pv. oortii]